MKQEAENLEHENFRYPGWLKALVMREMQRRGINKSDVIREALMFYFTKKKGRK